MQQDAWILDCGKLRGTEEMCAYLCLNFFTYDTKIIPQLKINDLLKDSHLQFLMTCSDLRNYVYSI